MSIWENYHIRDGQVKTPNEISVTLRSSEIKFMKVYDLKEHIINYFDYFSYIDPNLSLQYVDRCHRKELISIVKIN